MTSRVPEKKKRRSIPRGIFRVAADMLKRPSVAYLVAGLLVTYLAKMNWLLDLLSEKKRIEMGSLAFFVEDLVFWAVLIAAAWSAERWLRSRWTSIATTTIGVGTACFFGLNAIWLAKTGHQLTWSIIEIGIFRFEEIKPIVEYEMGAGELVTLLGVFALPALFSFAFQKKWKEVWSGDRSSRYTLLVPALLLVLSCEGYRQQQNPDVVGWRNIADNALISLGRTFSQNTVYADLPVEPELTISAANKENVDHRPRPNIVFVLLESIAWRATSLGNEGIESTPFLASLAEKGLEAQSMRVIMPHSTKSLVTALCGVTPALQQEIVETADEFPLRCLPEIFGEAGYATAFIQASKGSFEDLPRLAVNLGFDEFKDWYGFKNPPEELGYLGADDEAAVSFAVEWFEKTKGPRFLTLFTSATHHPYLLPQRMMSDPRVAGAPPRDPFLRYLLLTSDTDRLLADLFRNLEAMGEMDNTIFVVMGDHGESFGEHGYYQHDNVFTEEGLRIPFVIYAKGRIAPGTKALGNRTTKAIAPTILELCGLYEVAQELPGTSLLSPVPSDETRTRFACYYNNACMGLLEGNTKLVYLPQLRSWITFDLSKDPKERHPELDAPRFEAEIEKLEKWYGSQRYSPDDLSWSQKNLFGGRWICGEGYGRCRPSRGESIEP